MSSDRTRLVQAHIVVASGLVGVDIHASAGVVGHSALHPRHTVDPGRRIAPIEISRRCRDLPQRIVLRYPVEEKVERRPKADVTVLALGPDQTESSRQHADLHEPGGGLNKDRAAAVAAGSAAFERGRRDGERELVGIIWAERIAELGEQERLGAASARQNCGYGLVGAKLNGHIAPLVIGRIAAIGARSKPPIAGRDQHSPRRRNHAGDRGRTDGRDRLGQRDDGSVIFKEISIEARVADVTGDASTGTGNGRERYGNAFIWSEAMSCCQDGARIDQRAGAK
jgi:hypothetical protein